MIINLGQLNQDKVVDQIKGSDVLIVPSLFENQSGVILEAMNSKTFVIATRVGGIPEMIVDGKTGYLVDQSLDDLNHKINLYLGNDLYSRDNIIIKAKEYIGENHDTPTVIKQHLEFYKSIVQNSRK